MKKPIFLWSIPRSASTAFERTFIERPDSKVCHEPFSVSFYYSKDRKSNRYIDVETQEKYEYDQVLKEILASKTQPITFAKDLAYHVRGFWDECFLNKFENTFLIRNPIAALSSQYKLLPDFSLEETGYLELEKIFMAAADLKGEAPILVETEDFQRHPKEVLSAYCQSLEIPFYEACLTWKIEHIEIWSEWESWHLDAIKSTGIRPPKNIPDIEKQPDHVRKMVDQVMPIYERLIASKSKPYSNLDALELACNT